MRLHVSGVASIARRSSPASPVMIYATSRSAPSSGTPSLNCTGIVPSSGSPPTPQLATRSPNLARLAHHDPRTSRSVRAFVGNTVAQRRGRHRTPRSSPRPPYTALRHLHRTSRLPTMTFTFIFTFPTHEFGIGLWVVTARPGSSPDRPRGSTLRLLGRVPRRGLDAVITCEF